MWGVLTVDEPWWVCITQGDVYFPDPHCSGPRVLFKGTVPRGPVFHALSRSILRRFSGTPQGHRCRWAVCFVSFPDLSSSENQVLGECTVPGEPCILFTTLVLEAQFPWCTMRAHSQVCCMSPLKSWAQAVTLLNPLSLFLSFIFYPTSFWRDQAAFLGALCPPPAFRSCSTFKLSFDEFLGEKVVSPSYSSTILGPPRKTVFENIKYSQLARLWKIYIIPISFGLFKDSCQVNLGHMYVSAVILYIFLMFLWGKKGVKKLY